ncbi:YceI family protein [Pseudomonas citronellolis]|uniref:YceI family protein n=1 Tax=Pseudomonas citronellolis TaxID=53408 RepID=UPI0023E3523D|nr:YceI family protein [Pseudomonas citronellolis]MDF3937042.1 YceI family protein [Pseudomonas citronellolis]
MRSLFAFLFAACFAVSTQAAWYLDYESSRLSFVTGRGAAGADNNRFLVMHGSVDDQGKASLRIELDSVLSGVPLRDERMRDLLFEVERFPEAAVDAQLDLGPILALANGAQLEMRLPLRLSLHGASHAYRAEVLVTRLDERRFQVVTLSPLILDAAEFGLAPALEKLRKLADLQTINLAVPVGAVLIFAER